MNLAGVKVPKILKDKFVIFSQLYSCKKESVDDCSSLNSTPSCLVALPIQPDMC